MASLTGNPSNTHQNCLTLAPSNDGTALLKQKKDWSKSPLLQAANACDKFLNCAYVKKQLQEEMREERQLPVGGVEGLWRRIDKTTAESVEVEIYRRFLFEDNGLEPYEDPHPADHREVSGERQFKHYENRTPSL